MKKIHALLVAVLFGAAAITAGGDPASKERPAKNPPAAAPTEVQIIAKARASYPLKACVVSDEALGDLNEATAHVHRQAGKRDRVIFVCCEGCVDDFKKEPAKYLTKLDAAEVAKKN